MSSPLCIDKNGVLLGSFGCSLGIQTAYFGQIILWLWSRLLNSGWRLILYWLSPFCSVILLWLPRGLCTIIGLIVTTWFITWPFIYFTHTYRANSPDADNLVNISLRYSPYFGYIHFLISLFPTFHFLLRGLAPYSPFADLFNVFISIKPPHFVKKKKIIIQFGKWLNLMYMFDEQVRNLFSSFFPLCFFSLSEWLRLSFLNLFFTLFTNKSVFFFFSNN